MNHCFGVIGGDRRQAELARLLAADGNTVYTYGGEAWQGAHTLEETAAAEILILPLPLCREEGRLHGCRETTRELFARLRPGQIVLAGQVLPQQIREAQMCGITIKDYFEREELTIANAAATAEGAVQTAMEHMERTLLGGNCLVLGFGRIGKLLSCRLHGLGAQVTATARKRPDLAWIRAYGFQALHTAALDECLARFDVVFNTIPSPVLDERLLGKLRPDCLCIELASTPGMDFAAAERLGIQTVWAKALPGRLVPRTAAAAIRDVVYDMILEETR